MKKILLVLFLISLVITPLVYADRNVSTIKGYTATTLIKRGDWKVYRIAFVATSAGGNYGIYDSLTGIDVSTANIKTEASEATSLNGKPSDFTNKPLEGSTGLYLVINSANVIVEYE